MWRRIEIRNYRSIEHVTVDLAPFTVVVGPNGSGKSNFVDAFVFARDIANDASAAIQNRGGIAGVRKWSSSKHMDVGIDLRVADDRQRLSANFFHHSFALTSRDEEHWGFKEEMIGVARDGSTWVELSRERNQVVMTDNGSRIGVRGAGVFEIPETVSAMLLWRQLMAHYPLRGMQQVRCYRLDPDLMRQPQLVTERSDLDESGANIAAVIRFLRQTEKWQPVLMAMRKLVPGLVDIQAGMLGRYLGLQFFQKQAGEEVAEFAATEMSEGAIRALGILVAAQQQSEDQLLIVEEPEVSIHPGAAAVLFEFLKSSSRKGAVLLTTHSPELLDAAKDEEILVCEYRDGVTNVGPMESEQRRLVKEGLLSAAELMRSEPLRIEGMPPAVISHEEAQ